MRHVRVSGGIRSEDNERLGGHTVSASLDLAGGGGTARARTLTGVDGSFELEWESPAELDSVLLHVQVSDRTGRTPVATSPRPCSTGKVDFQIKLDRVRASESEPDPYRGGFERLVSRYNEMGRTLDPSDLAAHDALAYVSGVVAGWWKARDILANECGLDTIQVPRFGRRDPHVHVTRWDEVPLRV